MRAALYTRVSMAKQREGESLSAQRTALEKYASAQGWTIIARYEESASTWNGTRDQYEQMMDDARSRKFDVIMVWKLDRFGRRSGQIHSAIEELRALNVGLVLVAENTNLTENSIISTVMASSLALAAHLENQMRAARAEVAARQRKEMGLFVPGQLPSGYASNGKFQPARINEKIAPGIRYAYQQYATGRYSIMDLALKLNREGFYLKRNTPFTFRNLRSILNNRHYTGYIEVDGEWIISREPVLIEPELFDRVQAVMGRHAGAPRSAARQFRPYLLKGVLYCSHCGTKMYSQFIGKPRYAYYKCGSEQIKSQPCPANSEARTLVREDTLAPQVDQLIAGIYLPEDWQAAIQAELDQDETVRDIQRRRSRVEGRLKRLREVYIDGHIGKTEYRQRHSEYQAELNGLTVPDRSHVIDAGRYLADIKLLWDRASTQHRNEMMRAIFSRLWLDRIEQRIVSIEIVPEFNVLFEQLALVIEPTLLFAQNRARF